MYSVQLHLALPRTHPTMREARLDDVTKQQLVRFSPTNLCKSITLAVVCHALSAKKRTSNERRIGWDADMPDIVARTRFPVNQGDPVSCKKLVKQITII